VWLPALHPQVVVVEQKWIPTASLEVENVACAIAIAQNVTIAKVIAKMRFIVSPLVLVEKSN
jgi:hypothetical protein